MWRSYKCHIRWQVWCDVHVSVTWNKGYDVAFTLVTLSERCEAVCVFTVPHWNCFKENTGHCLRGQPAARVLVSFLHTLYLTSMSFLHTLCLMSVSFLRTLYLTLVSFLHSLYLTPMSFLHSLCLMSVSFLHTLCLTPVSFLHTLCLMSLSFLHTLCLTPVSFLREVNRQVHNSVLTPLYDDPVWHCLLTWGESPWGESAGP